MKFLLRTFLFFIIFSLLSNITIAKQINFIHITDIELNSENASQFNQTIKEINSYKDIDFVVLGGNNLKSANFKNLDILTHLIKKINKKTYILLGSSDVLSTSGVDKKFYLKKIRKALWFRHSKNPNYVFEKKDCVFIVMDGSKQYFQSTNGYYTKQELFWLEKNLEKYKDKKIIILQHFPLLEESSDWKKTAKTEEYIELLSKYNNIKAIISGHYDKNIEIKKDNILNIVTPSYSSSGVYKLIEYDIEKDFFGTYLVK